MQGDWGSGVWPDLTSLLLATASRGGGSRASARLPQGPRQTAVLCVSGGTCPCVMLAHYPPLPTQPLERQVLLVQPVLQTGNLGRKGLWPWFLPEVHGGHTQAYGSGLGRSHER